MMNTYFYAALHVMFCCVVMSTCICRLNLSSKAVLMRVRWAYAMLLTGYMCSALGPMYGDWPDKSTLAIDLGVVAVLLSGSKRWKRAAPEDVKTQPGALEPFRG